MSNSITGVLTAIVTPFTAEGAVNIPPLKQQVQRQLAAGNGIFCGGTNGEFFVLNEAEKVAVAKACVEEVLRSGAGGGAYRRSVDSRNDPPG